MNACHSTAHEPYLDQTEMISRRGKVMCMIVRAEPMPGRTTFYTPDDFNLQVGKVVCAAGSEIPRHTHPPVIRHLVGTPEILVVQQGRMILNIYTDEQDFLCAREMGLWDVAILLSGGHGFRFLQDTVLLEVKQGPYVGAQDK
jgi:hypothetical protein